MHLRDPIWMNFIRPTHFWNAAHCLRYEIQARCCLMQLVTNVCKHDAISRPSLWTISTTQIEHILAQKTSDFLCVRFLIGIPFWYILRGKKRNKKFHVIYALRPTSFYVKRSGRLESTVLSSQRSAIVYHASTGPENHPWTSSNDQLVQTTMSNCHNLNVAT